MKWAILLFLSLPCLLCCWFHYPGITIRHACHSVKCRLSFVSILFNCQPSFIVSWQHVIRHMSTCVLSQSLSFTVHTRAIFTILANIVVATCTILTEETQASLWTFWLRLSLHLAVSAVTYDLVEKSFPFLSKLKLQKTGDVASVGQLQCWATGRVVAFFSSPSRLHMHGKKLCKNSARLSCWFCKCIHYILMWEWPW